MDQFKVSTSTDAHGVHVTFPAEMPGQALVLVDSGLGFFRSGWLVSNGVLAAIPKELMCQLSAVHWQPAASSSDQSQLQSCAPSR